jgi:hypothetical protein
MPRVTRPEDIAKLMAIPGVREQLEAQDQAMRRALCPPGESPPAKKQQRELCAASFTPPGTWVVPLYIYAGDNLPGTSGARRRIGRAGHERKITSRILGPHLDVLAGFGKVIHGGGALKVKMTRLGGREMDYSNIVAACKYVQDTIALMFGIEDHDSRWHWDYGKKPGGPYGVQIEIEKF